MKLCQRVIGSLSIFCGLAFAPTIAQAVLVTYWDFEGTGGVEFEDKSGNGHTLTPVGGVETGADTGRTALILDGVDDQATTPGGTSSNLDMGTNGITISAWVRWDDQGAADRDYILVHDEEVNPFHGYAIEVRTGSSYTARSLLDAGDINANPTTTEASVHDGTWRHVAVVLSNPGTPSGTAIFYLDGVEQGNDNADASNPLYGSLSTMNPASTFWVGSRRGGDLFFNGSLDDIAVWNQPLPVTSIEGLADGTYTPLTAPLPDALTLDVKRTPGPRRLANGPLVDLSTYYYRVKCDGDSLDAVFCNSLGWMNL